MQLQYKKLQTHEKESFLQSCVIAECHITSENILRKKIREYIVVHMRVAELAYKRCIHMKHILHPTSHILLKE
jgi:hypothetical protein